MWSMRGREWLGAGRKRRVLSLVGASFLACCSANAHAEPVHTSKGALLSCPDPSVTSANAGHWRYYLVCTSGHQANAFPVRGSDDLRHWHLITFVFPHGKQPWWALRSPKGAYWAPSIYRIGGRWVVYFAAEYNRHKIHLLVAGAPAAPWVIGVATATSLRGPWRSRILHYRGQFNKAADEQEYAGGVIDPSMVQDPVTGQRYLFWAEQASSIWAAKLSPDGLTLDTQVHEVMWAQPGWECSTPRATCVIEGPDEIYRNGVFYLFYSGASTWTGSYAVGVAVSADPLQGQFQPLMSTPILSSGNGCLGPGGASAPILGPDGNDYLFYHAETRPNRHHDSADRYLMRSTVTWAGVDGLSPIPSPCTI